jgi:glycosyltransferase involved in cell wall biosynthesis
MRCKRRATQRHMGAAGRIRASLSMRIAHVVAFISPDGAFGGPVSVAREQCAALAKDGHDVTLYASAAVSTTAVSQRDGYTQALFPANSLGGAFGFSGMWSPRMARTLRDLSGELDIAHIHMGRHIVSLTSARALASAGVPFVVQPHGMITPSSHYLAKPVDRVYTRPLLTRASAVLSLTADEKAGLKEIAPHSRVIDVVNGIDLSGLDATEGDRDDVVLFLARLHPRKRPVAFVEMAALLRERFPETRFVVAGPDEGELDNVLAASERLSLGNALDVIGPVSPDMTQSLIASSRVLVLPSVAEVFPMTILEALRAGTPAVVTDSLGIAGKLRDYEAALITDGAPVSLATAVSSVLFDPHLRTSIAAGGFHFLRSELDIRDMVRGLTLEYERAIRVRCLSRRTLGEPGAGGES